MSERILDTTTDSRKKTTRLSHTWFEWAQLFIALSVPLAIAVYTIVQNNNDQAIAQANREKDLSIAEQRRAQELQMADDERKENILVDYHRFLAEHLNTYGMTLNDSTSARFVARFMTIVALNKLDSKRKTFLIQSLFEGDLIVNNKNTTEPKNSGIIPLHNANISGISLYSGHLRYLSLPSSNLVNANFTYVDLSCVNFYQASLENTDFSFTVALKDNCFSNELKVRRTIFTEAKLNGTRFYRAEVRSTDFGLTVLAHANMQQFTCQDCIFLYADLTRADFSSASLSMGSNFDRATMNETILVSARFHSVTFRGATLTRVRAIQASFLHCSFGNATLRNSMLCNTEIINSTFDNASLDGSSLNASVLVNVSFVYASMRHVDLGGTRCERCNFTGANLSGIILRKASFINSDFQRCSVNDEQLSQAASLTGSILPNGTSVPSF